MSLVFTADRRGVVEITSNSLLGNEASSPVGGNFSYERMSNLPPRNLKGKVRFFETDKNH